MLISTPMTVFASQDVPSQDEPTGSSSVTAEDIERLQEEIDKLTEQIKKLSKAIRAKQQESGGNDGGGSGNSSNQTPAGQDNYVRYGRNVVYQAGKIELNGGKSNVTFTINPAGPATVKSANSLAGKVGGVLINCIDTSSPGVGFRTARVNYFCSGVVEGDNIAVYQDQDGTWVQLPVVEIRKDHVVVLMTRHGNLAFIRVPALATITG